MQKLSQTLTAIKRRSFNPLALLTAVLVTAFASAAFVAVPGSRPASAEQASLYERLGGYNAIAATADDLVDRLYVNATLNKNPVTAEIHKRGEKAGFKFILTAWVVEKTGGPKAYFGRPLGEAHAHLGLSDREFDVVMTECRTTFYKFGVPKKEMDELMALLESYRGKVVAKS